MTSKISSTSFVSAVRDVVGNTRRVGLHEPDISELERRYVNECLDSSYVSSVGAFVDKFEEEIAAFTGAKTAVAVSNGTSALHIALVLAGVKPGDEVIVPALSFVATANAVSHAGAHPYFADIDSETFGLSVSSVRGVLEQLEGKTGNLKNPKTGRNVTAIVPMHTLGHPASIQQLVALGNEYGLPVVEDAAESLGSFTAEKHTGTFGLLGVLSFNGNKIITTGGGGMILTDDEILGRRAKHLTTTAKLSHPWFFMHDEIAWNYRLPNLNAAMGVAQLRRLPQFLAEKRALAAAYKESFENVSGVRFFSEPEGSRSNYWLSSVILDKTDRDERDRLIEVANNDGLQVRPLWELLSELPMYRENPRTELSQAIDIQQRVISLPSSPALARH